MIFFLDDLKQIRKELHTEKLKNESLNNEHFKRFSSLKDKQIVSGNLTIDFFMSSVKKEAGCYRYMKVNY